MQFLDERAALTVRWGSPMGEGRARCRQGSAAIERSVLKSLKFVRRVSVRREKASMTEGGDQTTATRLSQITGRDACKEERILQGGEKARRVIWKQQWGR